MSQESVGKEGQEGRALEAGFTWDLGRVQACRQGPNSSRLSPGQRAEAGSCMAPFQTPESWFWQLSWQLLWTLWNSGGTAQA